MTNPVQFKLPKLPPTIPQEYWNEQWWYFAWRRGNAITVLRQVDNPIGVLVLQPLYRQNAQ